MNKLSFIEKTKESLDFLLKEQEISKTEFLDIYYREEVNSRADESTLYDHRERVKKIPKKSSERWAAYINYFYRCYKKDDIHTQADRNAAWSMFLELDSRVATQKLEGGDIKAALASLASLFTKLRESADKEGPNSKTFYMLVNESFNQYLRPFTSKWHGKVESNQTLDEASFIKELEGVQVHLRELKEKLKGISE